MKKNKSKARTSKGLAAALRRWGPMLYRPEKRGVPFSFFPITYFPTGWFALTIIMLIDAACIPFVQWMHLPSALWVSFCSVPFVLALRVLLCGAVAMDVPALKGVLRYSKEISMIAEFLALASGTSSAMCLLSYLAATSGMPLIDAQLNAFDRTLGFDWPYWYQRSLDPVINRLLSVFYNDIQAQLAIFALIFSLWSRKDRLYEIYWCFFVGVLITIFISAVWPSIGAASIYWTPEQMKHIAHTYGYAHADLSAIRARTAPDFALHDPTGIITFPSFHTVCALMFIYAFRGIGPFFVLALVVNIGMIVSIPVRGNHYLADVVAGAVVTVVAIVIVQMVHKWMGKPVQEVSVV
jgi:hypothetical protein